MPDIGQAVRKRDKNVNPYQARFPKGTRVRIADLQVLEQFMRTWKYHNNLSAYQLEFAGNTAVVKDVGFYHGGDPLYELKEISGIWHEECLLLPGP